MHSQTIAETPNNALTNQDLTFINSYYRELDNVFHVSIFHIFRYGLISSRNTYLMYIFRIPTV
eukprot:859086-Amorphochlora_amoeboformis.AAC.1